MAPSLSMTPVIDVVLLLLIFFALTSSYVVNPGIKVDLPESSAGQIQRQPKEKQILITAEGLVYLDNKRLSMEELEKQLTENPGGQNQGSTAFIRADKRVTHGTVVRVMNIVKKTGYAIAIGTAPEKRGKP